MSLVGVSGVPDIYTAAIGFYATWLACRASSTLLHYFSQGVTIFLQQCNIWALQVHVHMCVYVHCMYVCMYVVRMYVHVSCLYVEQKKI